MRTLHPSHKTTIRYTWNRRIAMLLACILLFHAVFAGVEVHAQDAPSGSQTAAQTAAPIPTDSYTIDFDKTGAWDGYAQYSVTIWDTTTEPLENTALAAGDSGGILVGVGEVFGAEGAATVEGAGLTAVEEGIVLKTGRILSYSFPGLNMNKDVADKVCDEVKDGAEEPEEIAKSIGEEATKWSSENLDVEKMFTEKSIGHLDEIGGFDKRNGITGAHTPESFKEFVEGPRYVEILSKKKDI